MCYGFARSPRFSKGTGVHVGGIRVTTDAYLSLLGLLLVMLGAMLSYTYAPPKEPLSRPLPPELLKGSHDGDDPFRKPEAMDRRLEDFGRFNVRYNETDGLVEWQTLLRWIFRR